GVTGGGGIHAPTREKVNTAVNNGIAMVISAGNSGGASNIPDPGRAAMALTVAAANDVNQLTDYTSRGFTSPGSTAGQEEDFKPDLMAPGGSAGYYTQILSVDSNSGDGTAIPGGGSPFTDQQPNDYLGLQGTSMASPFAAGCAALVINALETLGTNWNFNSSTHPRLVKMLLCATASESNANRETNGANPSLERATTGPDGYPAGKDRYEGYGMINPDAAVAAVVTRFTIGNTNATLGSATTDQRVWASSVTLTNARAFSAMLTNPVGGDFDLYLYSAIPSAYGTPVLLGSSTAAGNGINESITYTPASDTNAVLVVKRVSGFGTFALSTKVNVPPVPLNPSLGTTTNRQATVAVVKLATDANGDSIVFGVASASTQGGVVSLVSGVVTYTPPANFSGSDTFTYTADDGHGGITNGTVTVTVAAGDAVSANVVYGPAIEGGAFVVRFAGIPGREYTIETNGTPTGTWVKHSNVTAPTTPGTYGIGIFQFSELTGGASSRFYRTVHPSY
ncbi:MAG TPA: S8 family serine peptidase, partial [Methylomirabilota bacterium]|nr:S8 family serine peptidase [Methylomirabilota bacterium]